MKRFAAFLDAVLLDGMDALVAAIPAAALGLCLRLSGVASLAVSAALALSLFAAGVFCLTRGDRDIEAALIELVASEKAGDER